jgi:CheY-like chemotaxis protein
MDFTTDSLEPMPVNGGALGTAVAEADRFSRQLLSAMLAFRDGEFGVRLPSDLIGVNGKIADAFNDIVTVSERRARETARVSRSVGKEGKLKQRMAVAGVAGGWADEVAAINMLIDDLVWPTTEVTRAVGAVAKGDLGQSMALEVDGRPLEGEFLRSAKLVNKMLSAMSGGTGQGATFTLKLPLTIVQSAAKDSGAREQPRADRQAPAIETVPRLDGIRVLAVDDEVDSLSLLRTVLEGVGAIVTTAGSAAAALDLIRQNVPDVMVADIGMPGMDGLQLIRALRKMEEPVRSMPAAALTAYARSQDRITSLASGFHMHLVKPIDPLELVVAVASLAPRRMRV